MMGNYDLLKISERLKTCKFEMVQMIDCYNEGYDKINLFCHVSSCLIIINWAKLTAQMAEW